MESTEPPKDKPTTQDTSDKPDAEATKSNPMPPVAHRPSESEPPKTHYDITCRPEKDWWEKWKPLVETVGGDYKTGSCYAFWGSDPKTWHVCDFYNIIR